MNYFLILRSNSYLKNLIIFFPFLFTPNLWSFDLFISILVIIFFFNLCCSSIYIWNDISDINIDRQHPEKKKRIIASNKISLKNAFIYSLLLLCISLYYFFFYQKDLILLVIYYIVLNLFYNFFIKKIIILDTLLISSLYVIRIYIGSQIINVPTSIWIVFVTFFTTIFLIFCKRKDPISKINYNKKILDILIVVTAIISILIYIFYTFSNSVFIQSNLIYISSVFVLLGFIRYIKIIFNKNNNNFFDPTFIILKDKILQLIIICWVVNIFIAIIIGFN